MLFYWLIRFYKSVGWLVRLPKPEDIVERDANMRCLVCGARAGSLRCVQQNKPQPRLGANERAALPVDAMILCQHRCARCGARWHEDPIAKVNPAMVLPSVARNEIEAAEDRWAKLYQYPTE